MTPTDLPADHYPLPDLPPAKWFRRRGVWPDGLGPDAYAAKCEWIRPRLAQIREFVHLNPEPGRPEFAETTPVLREVAEDEVGAWLACCWAAQVTLALREPLPEGHRWAITGDTVPDHLTLNVHEIIRDQMRRLAGEFLTALAREEMPKPLQAWGFKAVALVLAFLLDAYAYAHHPELPQPVTAVPEASEW